jgi:hypothetical protein
LILVRIDAAGTCVRSVELTEDTSPAKGRIQVIEAESFSLRSVAMIEALLVLAGAPA